MLKPREVLLLNGKSLYKAGVPHAFSESVGPWSVSRFMDDGGSFTAGPVPPVVGPGIPMELLGVKYSLVVNGTTADFVVDPKITKAVVLKAGNCELQITQYPKAIKCRVRYRVKSTDKIDYLAIGIVGAQGYGSQFNTNRDGQWDGRVQAKLPSGSQLHALVLDAKEKYPRGYEFGDGVLWLTLHENLEPKDTSKAGVTDLRAYCTGTFSTALPAEYAALLTNDPDVKNAAKEISASEQATRVSDVCLGMDFWLSIGEPVEPQPPLVLLDGFESPIWSKSKPGIDNDGLRIAEQRILGLASAKLASGPRGNLLYGDFPEQPNSFNRVRGNNHYFWTTLAWRSLLRTGDPQWYALARAFANYYRDSCWLDGWVDHAKGIVPWSGPKTTNGHWCDSEALLFAWLVDGDALSLLEYERWLKAFTPPTTNDRESQVACRMCRVAHWYTGDAKWKTIADGIEARIRAEVARVQATEAYNKFGVGMPTGVNWHPLAFNVPLELDGICPAGILSARQLARSQRLDEAAGLILYGMPAAEGAEIGFGPLGESYVGLQLEAIADYYRARPLACKRRVIYGTDKNNYCRVQIEKTDDLQSWLTVRLFSRLGGDFHPQKVYLTSPDGRVVELTAGMKFPAYVDSGQGWVLDPQFRGWADGVPCAQKSFPLTGKAGRYEVAVTGYKPMVFGGMSSYVEWQNLSGVDWQYPAIDSDGKPATDGILVGTD